MIYDPSLCKIKLFKVIIQDPKILFLYKYFYCVQTSDELELLGVIDVMSATFNYDLNGESNGVFKIW